jgi:hypothetical protein
MQPQEEPMEVEKNEEPEKASVSASAAKAEAPPVRQARYASEPIRISPPHCKHSTTLFYLSLSL